MYNTAARQLLGRPILTGKPASWADALGLSSARGRAPGRGRRCCAAASSPPSPRRTQTRSRSASGRRVRPHRRADRAAPGDQWTTGRRWCSSTTSLPNEPASGSSATSPAWSPTTCADRSRCWTAGSRSPRTATDRVGVLAVEDALVQGPGRERADASGDRGLAELHRGPERQAPPHRGEACLGRRRGRAEPSRPLGRRRGASVHPRPRAQRAGRPRPGPAAARQPRGERDQVHPRRPGALGAGRLDAGRGAGLGHRRRHRPRDRGAAGSGGADLRGVPPRTGRRSLRRHRVSAWRSPDGSRPPTAGRCRPGATRRAAPRSPSPCPRPDQVTLRAALDRVDVLPRMAMFSNSPTAIIEANIDDPP